MNVAPPFMAGNGTQQHATKSRQGRLTDGEGRASIGVAPALMSGTPPFLSDEQNALRVSSLMRASDAREPRHTATFGPYRRPQAGREKVLTRGCPRPQ